MTNDDNIIADLLKKIDNLQEAIAVQNNFIMKMATYRDERDDKSAEIQHERFKELKDLIMTTGIIEIFTKWLVDKDHASRRPPYSASRPTKDNPADEPDADENLGS